MSVIGVEGKSNGKPKFLSEKTKLERCDLLLDSCAHMVKKQRKVITRQNDVIDMQYGIVEELKAEAKSVKSKSAGWLWGLSASNVIMLLLLL